MKAAAFLGVALLSVASAIAQTPPRPLTNARELRLLPPEQAEQRVAVRLRAVVTFIEPNRTIFLQDETGGTFARFNPNLPLVQPGHLVQVQGVSYPGLYVPGIETENIRILGTNVLPAAMPVTFEQLAAGQFNYERVEVRGIVRAFTPGEEGRGLLLLGMGGTARLEIHANAAEPAAAERLVDSAVRVQGLAAGFINDKRQLVSPHLRVMDLSGFAVEERAPEKPWDLAITPSTHLLRFSPTGSPGHRVKVRGVVTHHEPGRALFIRDGTQGLYLQSAQPDSARPGDVVEALGFPAMGTFSAYLQDAVFRKTGSEPEPEPIAAAAREITKGSRDADLVRLDAEMLDVLRTASHVVLVMRSGDTAFHARIAGDQTSQFAELRPGSRLRLTGVARAEQPEFRPVSFSTSARSFEIVLRGPGDIEVLHAPSWWTARRLGIAAVLLLALVLAALAWVVLLRRRVAQQTAIIHEKVATAATMEERQRIAREFHDTLEQELVGVALRLDAAIPAVAEAKPRDLLEATRRLIQRIQAEARGFLWNLRDRSLEAASLADAIAHTTADLWQGREFEVRVSGEPRRLPGVIEHELLRIAQEASNNAAKHGRAERIEIEIAYAADSVRLRIADDGAGFDPHEAAMRAGRFGLTGMRERVKKLGGTFELRSQPGSGTEIELRVPVERSGR